MVTALEFINQRKKISRQKLENLFSGGDEGLQSPVGVGSADSDRDIKKDNISSIGNKKAKGITKTSEPQIIRDQDTGKPTGIILPDGRKLIGIPEKEVGFLAEKYGTNRGLDVLEAEGIAGEIQSAELAKARLEALEGGQPQTVQGQLMSTEAMGQAGLMSGTVTPITPDDLINLVTFAVGGIGVAAGVKKGAKIASRKLMTKAAAGGVLSAVERTAAKAGLKGLLSKKAVALGAAVFGVSKLVGFGSSKIASRDAQLSQIRESITLEVQEAKYGNYEDAFANLDEYEEQINEIERDIKKWELFTKITTLNFNKTDPVHQRIQKLRRAIDTARDSIRFSIASGQVNAVEEATMLLDQLINEES